MCDRITYCDIVECAECPKYGDDCDGDKRNDDLISRADAIEAVKDAYEMDEFYKVISEDIINVLSALPSAEAEKHRIYKDGYNTGKAHASAEASQNLAKPNKELKGSDVISRDVVLANIDERLRANGYGNVGLVSELNRLVGYVRNIPSAEAVQGWRTGKPTENGEYMVTLDAWGHRYINIMHYAKPQMPNRNVDGMCWYRSDDEWGDVVYDDNDILAWMPLPKPYKGGEDK